MYTVITSRGMVNAFFSTFLSRVLTTKFNVTKWVFDLVVINFFDIFCALFTPMVRNVIRRILMILYIQRPCEINAAKLLYKKTMY